VNSRFNQAGPLVIVRAKVFGPTRNVVARPAVDTGATPTVIAAKTLRDAGYAPEQGEPVTLSTVGGLVHAFRLNVRRLTCLGSSRVDIPVVAHDVTRDSRFHGLLGLDFLREFELTINFPKGRIGLTVP
jgi:predicted aspartyl protease